MSSQRLFEAIAARDVHAVGVVLREHPRAALACASPSHAPHGWKRYSPVHAAGDADVVTILEAVLDANADIDARNDEGRTALHDALENSRRQIEHTLIARGAHQDVCAAAIRGDIAELHARLEEDAARANDRNTGLSPLGWASFGNRPDAARVLLDAGARLDDQELFCAAQCGHADVARVLIDRGADPNGRAGELNRTPLHIAAELVYTCDASAFIETLLELGADPTLTTTAGERPLDVARRLAAEVPASTSSSTSVERRRYDEIVRILMAHR